MGINRNRHPNLQILTLLLYSKAQSSRISKRPSFTIFSPNDVIYPCTCIHVHYPPTWNIFYLRNCKELLSSWA